MYPHKNSASKPKTSVLRSQTSANNTQRKPVLNASIIDSKNSIPEKTSKTDSIPAVAINQCKDPSKLVQDSVLDANTGADCNASDLSIIKMLDLDIQKDSDEDSEKRKFREEIDVLKRDLSMKNTLVERLMKENSDLRREMDELLSTVETAKDQINIKLKGCNERILELESEIKTLKDENRYYKEQIQRYLDEKNYKTFDGLEECVGKYYKDSKQRIENFYKNLNQQIGQFLEISKGQYETLNSNLQNCIEGTKQDTPLKMLNRPSKNQARSAFSKFSQVSAQTKMKSIPNPINIGSRRQTSQRSSSITNIDRRKRIATIHNLNDIVSTVQSESSWTSLAKNDQLKKTPKDLFSPKVSTRDLFRINSLRSESEKNI